MNIMLASVTERTREIGIRRAIGAKRKQIITQFLIETVVLSTLGGIVGLGLGIFISLVITLTAGMPTAVRPLWVMLPLFISIVIGIGAGLYPAWRAAEVDPIIALRHE
jgi:putative ABC transport system permease protein